MAGAEPTPLERRTFGWGIGVAFHIWDVLAPENPPEDRIRREMDRLSRR
ncbi:hypothetical protein ACPCHT_21270 [Nucisporomicrobium flavum]